MFTSVVVVVVVPLLFKHSILLLARTSLEERTSGMNIVHVTTQLHSCTALSGTTTSTSSMSALGYNASSEWYTIMFLYVFTWSSC